MILNFTYDPSEQDIAVIYDGLCLFNDSCLPGLPEKTFGCFARCPEGKIIGGLSGKQFSSSLHVSYFWVSEAVRKEGLGSQLLRLVESEALKNNIENLYLDTYTFQAPDFYEKLGFIEVGRYTDFLKKGVDRIFYRKQLTRS